MDTPFNGGSMSDLERIFSQADMPNVIKEFVHPGKTCREMMMRTVFRDENERNDALIFLRKCEEFGLSEYIEMLINWLAASVSVGGRSRKEVLQATTGIIVPGLYSDTRRDRQRVGRDDERSNN